MIYPCNKSEYRSGNDQDPVIEKHRLLSTAGGADTLARTCTTFVSRNLPHFTGNSDLYQAVLRFSHLRLILIEKGDCSLLIVRDADHDSFMFYVGCSLKWFTIKNSTCADVPQGAVIYSAGN